MKSEKIMQEWPKCGFFVEADGTEMTRDMRGGQTVTFSGDAAFMKFYRVLQCKRESREGIGRRQQTGISQKRASD